MKTLRLKFLTIGLPVVLLASACAPALPASPATEVMAPPVNTPPLTVTSESNVNSTSETTLAPTQPPPAAVATSRGPNLEATDPTTVALASGGVQLVEFFRFT